MKASLHKMIYEAALELSDGDCDEVYQLNLQIFPQTQIKS
jgi:hypothetical protein